MNRSDRSPQMTYDRSGRNPLSGNWPRWTWVELVITWSDITPRRIWRPQWSAVDDLQCYML